MGPRDCEIERDEQADQGGRDQHGAAVQPFQCKTEGQSDWKEENVSDDG